VVAVWRIDKIFAEWESNGGIISEETLVPTFHVTAHNSYVRHISWNSIDNPTHIMTCGHDGKLQMFEERDPWIKHLFQKIRSFMITFTWAAHYNVIYFADSENSIRFIQMEDPKKTTAGLILHRGCVWGSASSYFHPFIASCAADGMVKIANICRLRDRHQRPVQVTVYRLTFNGKEFRYWDNIKAEETTFNNLTYENMPAPKFSSEEAIQRVSWCPNECAGVWLASGGAGGLVRIDCTEWE
ncbi:12580_t:CDS:2, partial [Ambispora leptoticha]